MAKASPESFKLAEDCWAAAQEEGRPPTTEEIACVIDAARVAEYKDAARAGIRSITQAQLEVIAQVVDMLDKAQSKQTLVGVGKTRSGVPAAIKALKAEHARLKGIDEYRPRVPETSPIIAPTATALPKGKLTGVR